MATVNPSLDNTYDDAGERTPLVLGDLDYNADQIVAAVKQAAAGGARLVLTPELSLCGYPPRDLLLRPGFILAMRQKLEQLAAALPTSVAVLVGFAEPNTGADTRGEKPLYINLFFAAARISVLLRTTTTF